MTVLLSDVVSDVPAWHRDNLQFRDGAAVARSGGAYPAFVFDPWFYRSDRVCDGRPGVLHESPARLTDPRG